MSVSAEELRAMQEALDAAHNETARLIVARRELMQRAWVEGDEDGARWTEAKMGAAMGKTRGRVSQIKGKP